MDPNMQMQIDQQQQQQMYNGGLGDGGFSAKP